MPLSRSGRCAHSPWRSAESAEIDVRRRVVLGAGPSRRRHARRPRACRVAVRRRHGDGPNSLDFERVADKVSHASLDLLAGVITRRTALRRDACGLRIDHCRQIGVVILTDPPPHTAVSYPAGVWLDQIADELPWTSARRPSQALMNRAVTVKAGTGLGQHRSTSTRCRSTRQRALDAIGRGVGDVAGRPAIRRARPGCSRRPAPRRPGVRRRRTRCGGRRRTARTAVRAASREFRVCEACPIAQAAAMLARHPRPDAVCCRDRSDLRCRWPPTSAPVRLCLQSLLRTSSPYPLRASGVPSARSGRPRHGTPAQHVSSVAIVRRPVRIGCVGLQAGRPCSPSTPTLPASIDRTRWTAIPRFNDDPYPDTVHSERF